MELEDEPAPEESELGDGEIAGLGVGRPECFSFLFLRSVLFFPFGGMGRRKGVLLGPVRPVWDKIWSFCKSSPPLLRQRRSRM